MGLQVGRSRNRDPDRQNWAYLPIAPSGQAG